MRAQATMLLLGTVLLAGPVAAQQHQHAQGQRADSAGMMQMQGMMDMHAMMPGPMAILQLREPLGLTASQVQRIEAIRDRVQQAHGPHAQAAMQAMQEAAGMLAAATPDLSRYEAKLREAANHHLLAHVAMTRGWVEAREVLTPEQRSNLEFGMKLMQQMMRERMQGMMGSMGMGGMGPGGTPQQGGRPPMRN